MKAKYPGSHGKVLHRYNKTHNADGTVDLEENSSFHFHKERAEAAGKVIELEPAVVEEDRVNEVNKLKSKYSLTDRVRSLLEDEE